MKKIIPIILCVFILLSFCSCSGSDLSYVKSKGTLTIGVTEYKPMDFRDENGKWVGFDAELATIICEKLNVEAEFKMINWDEKTDKLKSKEIDCVWNGYTVNNVDKVSFSKPYAKNSPVLVIKDSEKENISGIDKLAGMRVAFEIGSSSERIANELNCDIDKVSFGLQKEALIAVVSGEADACIVDKIIYDSLVHTDLTVIHTFDSEEFAVGFREGSDIVNAIDPILKELEDDGTLSSLASKYKIELL